MRKSLVSIFFGSVLIVALVSNAQAQMCGCMGEQGGMTGGMGHHEMGTMQGMGGMHGGGMMGGMMMEEDHPMWNQLMGLGLEDKQKESLMALRSKTMKDMVKKSADEQIAGIELRDLLDKDPVDMKAVEALVKKQGSLKTEMFLAHIKAREEMKAILTPEQRKKMKEMMGPGHGAGCGMMGGMMHGDAEHKDMPMHEHMH